MNNNTDDFNNLSENLIAFSPNPDDDDLYVPSSHPPSSDPHSSTPLPSDFVVFSQNAHKCNSTTHAILQIASSLSPPADLILIQEPYFGRIGVNTGMAQGNPIYDVHGCPKHTDWQPIVPLFSPHLGNPNVVTYVPNQRVNWTFQLRTDLVSALGLMCLQIDSTSPSFLVFNIYNNINNSACNLMTSLPPLIPRSMFIGDFNLHHPLWSRDDNLNKQSDEAD